MSEIVPKLRGTVPSGVAGGIRYGLEEVVKDNPFRVRAAIVLFSGDTVSDKSDGTTEVRFTVRRWETISLDEDLVRVREIMQSAGALRLGGQMMPDEVIEVEGEAFDGALERWYEDRERAAESSPRAADLLRNGSGVLGSDPDRVIFTPLDSESDPRPEGTARGTHNLPGMHG